MIQIIDKILYLPRTQSKIPISVNETRNQAYKKLVASISQQVQNMNSDGKSATISIIGKVGDRNPEIEIRLIECNDEDLLQKLQEAFPSMRMPQ